MEHLSGNICDITVIASNGVPIVNFDDAHRRQRWERLEIYLIKYTTDG